MKKIISVIGARPQFIKHAPMNLALAKYFHVKIIHTGQHYDENMSDIFFQQLQLPKPDYFLSIQSSRHGEMTAMMLTKVEEILMEENPDAVLLYGDTNSTLAGALAASKLYIPVIHIEAGLRSFNRSMPEEINRVITDHTSDYLFCPDENSKKNLQNEGITNNVYVCGDVMKDALMHFASQLERPGNLKDDYVFATIHRPYNTDDHDRMELLLQELNSLGLQVIFSIHPRTKKLLEKYGISLETYANILFIDPVGYYDCLAYQKFALCVITDSGGMQKEAYWLRKKCVTIRKETEWTDTLKNGWNTLIFDDLSAIREVILINDPMPYNEDLYGGADSAEKIAAVLNEKI